MPRQKQLLELIGLIYDAASEPAQWQVFLERLGEVTRSSGLYLHNRLPLDGDSRGGIAHELDPAFLDTHRAYYWKLSPSERHPVPEGFTGVRVWRQLLSHAELRKTEYWNDWMRPQSLLDTFSVTFERRGLGGRAMLSGQRRVRERDYSADDLRFFELLRPHLHRAFALNQRLAEARGEIESSRGALDRVRLGLLFVDPRGRVLRANRSAEELLAEGDGVALRAGRLVAREREADRALERLIASASETSNGDARGAGGWTTVPRAQRHALPVLVSPLSPERSLGAEVGATALVMLSDPERTAKARVDVLGRVFGLTPKESRVVALLASGRTPDEIAEDLSVQANTVRMHLKSVFAKTGTHRQSEIVLLVERTLGATRFDPD